MICVCIECGAKFLVWVTINEFSPVWCLVVWGSSWLCRISQGTSLAPPTQCSRCPVLVMTTKSLPTSFQTAPWGVVLLLWRTTGQNFKLYSKVISQLLNTFLSYSSPILSCSIQMEEAAIRKQKSSRISWKLRLPYLWLYFQFYLAYTRCSTNICEMKLLGWPWENYLTFSTFNSLTAKWCSYYGALERIKWD